MSSPDEHASQSFAARAFTQIAWIASFLVVLFASASAATTGDFTKDQADIGQQVYNSACSSCHGSNLEGQAGPALAGSKFEGSLQFSKMSGQQLFDFISTQMPADNPGSLSHDKYAAVMAYILSKNGYPSGSKKLSDRTLGQVQLLPFPNKEASGETPN